MRFVRFLLISFLLSSLYAKASNPDPHLSFCGFSGDYISFYPILNQNIIDEQNLNAYTRCRHIFCGAFAGDHNNNQNVDAWSNYFDGKISDQQVSHLIYSTELDDYKQFLKDNFSGSPLSSVSRKKAIPFLRYMILAKQSEGITSNAGSSRGWYQGEKKQGEDPKPELLKKYLDQVQREKNSFLKNRYGFQLVRLAHYLQRNKMALNFFERYLSKSGQSNYMYYRALEQRSGAAYNLDRQQEAAEGFIEVYANLPDRHRSCALSLNAIQWHSIDFKNFFKKEDSLFDIKSFYRVFYTGAPAKKAMMKLTEKTPNSTYLKLLAVRQADQIQEELFPVVYDDFESGSRYSPEKSEKEIKTMGETLEKIARTQLKNDKVKDIDFWKIMKAVSLFPKKDFVQIKKLMKTISEDSKLSAQAQRLRFAAAVSELSEINRKNINSLFLELKKNPDLFQYEPLVAFFFNRVALFYSKTNNQIFANLSYWPLRYRSPKTDLKWEDIKDKPQSYGLPDRKYKFLNDTVLKRFKSLLNYTEKTDFEQVVLAQLKVSPEDYLHEMRGSYYLGNGDIDKAISNFEKIENPRQFYQEKFRPQIFSGAIHEYFDTPFMQQSDSIHLKYESILNKNGKAAMDLKNTRNVEEYTDNKLALAKTIKRLQDLAGTEPENDGDYYYMLGNVYYNMSRNGWFLNDLFYFSNDRRNNLLGYNYGYSDETQKNKGWHIPELATYFYKKVLEKSKDKDVKAKATFMLAKTNFCYDYIRTEVNNRYELKLCGPHKSYFEQLNQNYSDTQFQKEVIKECSWYRAFLN